MSDYTKATNFTLKDGLTTGDPGKIIKGSEIDAEYTSISNAVASKADLNSPTFTGTPEGPTPVPSTDSSGKLATTAFVQSALIGAYPVGSIYMNAAVATNPATLLGFGQWQAFGAGKVPVGIDAADSDFNTVEETGGTKDAIIPTHSHTAGTLATDSQGSHQHTTASGVGASTPGSTPALFAGLLGGFSGTANLTTNSAGSHVHSISGSTANTGESATGKNLQPYIVVYMWKRTA
jgi:hypothetical protein